MDAGAGCGDRGARGREVDAGRRRWRRCHCRQRRTSCSVLHAVRELGRDPDYEAGSYSVFGFGPIQVAGAGLTLAAGVAAAIILFVLANRLAIALASGLLVAFGLDAVTGWAANSGTYATEGYHVEPGAFVGVAGGVVLLVGGVIAALSLFARRST